MDPKEFILIADFCECHNVQYSFINSLNEFGLLEIQVIEENEYIDPEQVRELERMMRLHYDLEINLQGIDAIRNLLNRVSELQDEVRILRNRLSRYEE
ncbi:chaperone modulator CbpM [Salinimicrobium gaetbulicola]|uniref:Chaperone modulator CbpM n=1 Tax=Salinimicrobium gaetbulicola TaxID=999702 RepID=A0ABW3IG47_9FLAO